MYQDTDNNQLLEALRAGVIKVSIDGEITYSNRSANLILGYDEESIDGSKYSEVLFGVEHPDEDPRCAPLEFSLREGEVAHIVAEEIVTEAGQDIAIEIFCSPLEDGGAVISFDDVTDRRHVEVEISDARERALQAAQAKSRFLANMSHEIRTPLSGIKGTAELLASGELNDEQSELVDMLRSSADYLNSIVNDVLDLSKLEAGKYVHEKGVVNVKELIRTTVSFYKNSPDSSDLKVDFSYVGHETVITSERPIRQILNNLVSNAVKFTQEGYVRVDAVLEGGRLKIKVIDTGIGVDAEYVSRLFKPFEQQDASDVRSYEGTGLGLSISKKLAEQLDGELEYEPGAEQGSVFSLELNVEPHFESAGKEEDSTEGILLGKRVLVVDDNPTGLKVSSALLARLGARVDVANDGVEAIEFCKAFKFDAVLIDLQMPQMDGYQATRRIKRLENAPKRIVAFTASTAESVSDKIVEAGMSGVIFKPFSENDLARAVLGQEMDQEQEKILDLESDLIQHSVRNFIDDDVYEGLLSVDTGESGSFLKELLGVFASHGVEKFHQLENAINSSNLPEAKRIAHNLKGSAANVGMSKLVDLFRSLEEELESGEQRILSRTTENIRNYLNDVFTAITRFVEE